MSSNPLPQTCNACCSSFYFNRPTITYPLGCGFACIRAWVMLCNNNIHVK